MQPQAIAFATTPALDAPVAPAQRLAGVVQPRVTRETSNPLISAALTTFDATD